MYKNVYKCEYKKYQYKKMGIKNVYTKYASIKI